MKPNIPKKIHFIWIGKEKPWYIDYYIALTKEKYTDYEVKVWGNDDIDVNHNKLTQTAWSKKKYAFVSDYFRAKILYEEGGVYLDTDMVPIRNFESYLEDKLTLGFEFKKMVSTGFVACEPGHPFLSKVLQTYNKFDFVSDKDVKFIINNELWTIILVKYYNLMLNNRPQRLAGNIYVYDYDHFSSSLINDKSVFLHDHKLSWTSPTKAKLMNWFLFRVKKYDFYLEYPLKISKVLYFHKNKKIMRKLDEAERINEKY